MLAGLISIPFGFPGVLIILLSALFYAIATHFAAGIGGVFLALLCVLTLVAETADNWLTALGAKRYGASTQAIWLSFLGGIVGAIALGAPFAFILGPLAPVAGGFAGAFLIVVAAEYYRRRDAGDALRAGWGTFVGRLAGMVLKVVIAAAMIVAVAVSVFF
jgi:uncharacterized protein YqgC (DUF456 family)